jgi:hypothetical protein
MAATAAIHGRPRACSLPWIPAVAGIHGKPLWTAGFQPAFFAILEMHAKVSPLRLILLAPNAGWKPAVQRSAPS